ncbi:response regulator with CheY-like receiver, AAA-type ATPase, and DNA-binding domains [Desulfosporosinus acidiphilus SJ4]|uniref:Stage 0 sporulation protein A homolog n=1 Tax=Desulfosporosinus acidiphilus (strain DSM 22704 / JCM 16185 / SJ4) TaxID=646529 RepID=I4D0Y6_DESAJ|nr:sigma-54 dependent transcriptional regulator [Desulfosporosinus acidiphilus]AFM39460.1 response regulator with CheY-like receiver, AAA-type ATPase, and DNA-binding domains [Desulfosporosinus acidiphilus SJ4]
MKQWQKILILDDEEALRTIIAQRLKRKGYEVLEAGTAQEGLSFLKETLIDAVLLDIKLPDGDGLALLPTFKQFQPDLQVVMLTGNGTIESAIEAMKLGAYDYLTKPCNLSELEITLQKALEKQELLRENKGLRQVVNRQTPELKMIAESTAMLALLEMTRKVAQTDASVLVQGESGVGKELIAKTIHFCSSRFNRPFIPVNSGAIPESLIESELFGHEKGAFTGAAAQKIGLVEMADKGTLFLDEIGEMPLSIQIKLLRFLESGEFRRVGDTRLRRVDVRIVAATNRDLRLEISQGRFREDLFYRLNGLTLIVPPLRERRDDILPLSRYFLESHCAKSQDPAYTLLPETEEKLLNYSFPGNVRELCHLIERGRILAIDGKITSKDIWGESEHIPKPSPVIHSEAEFSDLFRSNHYPTLEEVEKHYIAATLKKAKGNKTQTAGLLGISVRNLYRKLQSYEVDPSRVGSMNE